MKKIFQISLLLVFSISGVNAHIALISPSGGETFAPGEIVDINWEISIPHNQLNWDLYFSTDGGETWEVIEEDVPLAHPEDYTIPEIYQWTVPDVETSRARILIIQDNENVDYTAESGDMNITNFPYAPDDIVYATSGTADNGRVYSVDVITGMSSLVTDPALDNLQNIVINRDGKVYVLDSLSEIFRIGLEQGNFESVGVSSTGVINAAAFDETGALYAFSGTGLFKSTTSLSQFAMIGTTGILATGAAIDPSDNTLWACTENGSIFRIDRTTATAQEIGLLGFDGVSGIAFDNKGDLFALALNTTGMRSLFSVNKSTGAGSLIGETGNQNLVSLTVRVLFMTAPVLEVSPENLDFMTTEVGTVKSMEIALSNTGNEALIVTDISINNSIFTIQDMPETPFSMETGEQMGLTVQFQPMNDAGYSGTLRIFSNSKDQESLPIGMEGEGLLIAGSQPGICYATTGLNDGGRLLRIDRETGSGTLITNMEDLGSCPAIAVDSNNRIHVFDPSDNSLHVLDPISGKSSVKTILPVIDVAMDFDETDVLYFTGLDPNTNKRGLYRLELSASPEFIGETEQRFTGVSFSPYEELFGITKDGDIFTINKNSSATTPVGGSGQANATDIAFDRDGNLYGVFGGGKEGENRLMLLDPETGGTLEDIGTLGFSSVSGLEINGNENILGLNDELVRFSTTAYPNPTFGKVKFKYTLSHRHDVDIRIYSQDGRFIRSVFHGKQQAGVHQFLLDIEKNSTLNFINIVLDGHTFYTSRILRN